MYGRLLHKWNGMYVKKFEQAELMLKNYAIYLEWLDKNTQKYKQKTANYEEANAKLNFVEKANGLHNIPVTEKIPDSVIRQLNRK